MSLNTQRTLKALRKDGFTCGMVERYISQAGPFGKRIDLFGIIDIIAIRPITDNSHCEIYGIQSCGQAFSEHNKKILASENSIIWLQSGAKLELWGWRKVLHKRGGKKRIWKPRIMIYYLIEGLVWGAEKK